MANTLSAAAGEMERARKQLAAARRKLARLSRVGTSPHVVLSGEWKRAGDVLDARRKRLLSQPGVVGVALGHRHRAGAEHDEVCITIFVEKKWTRAELRERHLKALPSRVSAAGRSIPVDVIALGKPKPHGTGDAIASIGHESPPIAGTIGAVATDLATKRPVLITAGHVAAQTNDKLTVPSKDDATTVVEGDARLVLTSGVDAAKVEMSDMNGIEPFLPPGPVAGWRPVSNDVDTVVHMYGRTSHGQSGVIKFVNADVFNLENTLLVKIFTDKGDSGAAILDNSNLILGFLYGLAPADVGDFRVFCPASLVLERLGCDI